MEQVENSKIGSNSNNNNSIVNRKRGIENLGDFITANKKSLLSKESNKENLEDYIPDLKRVQHQAIIKSSNTNEIYKQKNTPKYETRFEINTPQYWRGDQTTLEIGLRLEDKNGVLLTENSRNELCPVDFLMELLIKKLEVRVIGDTEILNNSPMTRERIINQHLKRYSLSKNQMEILAENMVFNPTNVGEGIVIVNETTIGAATKLTPTQQYFYKRAKEFHKKISSDGYVYFNVPLCFIDNFFAQIK